MKSNKSNSAMTGSNEPRGLNNIGPLLAAIKGIPTGQGPWNAREAVRQFLQMSMGVVEEASAIHGQRYPGRFFVNIFHRRLGFVPLPAGEENRVEGWEEKVVGAYFAAVKSNQPFADILTRVQVELLGQKDGCGLAQHMTPSSLSDGASRFLAPNMAKQKQGVVRVGEPTCGAGALVLAHVRKMIEQSGKGSVVRLAIWANDIDPVCAAMTSLQLLAGQIVHGIPLGEVEVTVGNLITEYHELQTGMYCISRSFPDFESAMFKHLAKTFQSECGKAA